MVKDYANKNTSTPKRRKNKPTALVLIALAMIIPLLLFYSRHHSVAPPKENTLASDTHIASPTKNTTNLNPPADYDFYTLLPSMEVKVSPDEIKQNRNNPTWTDGAFILQVAALQQVSQAVHLRDHLKSLGFKPFIEEFRKNDITFYRVLIGPYQGLDNIAKIQEKLKEHHFESALLKLKASAP